MSFQTGVDTIISGCTTYGSTPTASTPSAIVNAIKAIYTNRYNAGVTAGGSGKATVKVTSVYTIHNGSTNSNGQFTKSFNLSSYATSIKNAYLVTTYIATSAGMYTDNNNYKITSISGGTVTVHWGGEHDITLTLKGYFVLVI